MKFLQKLAIAVFLGAVLYAPISAQNGDSYRLFGNSIRVDRASHWQNWIYQNDLVGSLNVPVSSADIFRVDSEGLRPVFFRRNINVAPDATKFTYKDLVRAGGELVEGGADAQTNDLRANSAIDDDLETYWEPEAPSSYEGRLSESHDFDIDNLRKWELEIDLGQLTYVDSITVVFPAGQVGDEFLGEPVKSFALFASMGERFPFPLGNRLNFTLIGQISTDFSAGKIAAPQQFTTQGGGVTDLEVGETRLVVKPGTDGRYVQATFALTPLDRADWDLDGLADINGTFLHYIRLKVTDSDLWRDFALGAGEEARLQYEELPSERQGALVYQRLTAGGLLVELQDDEEGLNAREKYAGLPEDKRGPILYFGKEVPRISEVQVWAKGDNYALQPEKRGGASYENGGLGAPGLATDGLYDSEWQANTWSPIYLKGTAWYDLGAVFWVDNVSIVNKRINQSHLGAFLGPDVLVSDGTLLKPLSMEQRDDFPQLEEGLKWDNIITEEHVDNHDAVVRIFRETFSPRKIRFLQIRDIDVTGQQSGRYGSLATLGEIQLYGEGYPVSVWAFSPPISLTDTRGEFIRKTLPSIAWEGDVIVRDVDPVTGGAIERIEPLENHLDVRIQIQTRTSDQTDTNFTYYQVVEIAGAEERTEVAQEVFDELVLSWAAWDYWNTLSTSNKHASNTDDDGDGVTDEDPIDFIDNDGDGLVDEDGKKLRRAPRSSFDRDGELAFVGWSEWSESYAPTNGQNEATITSPNPRRFLQVRVNIVSDDPFKTARIRSLRVDLAPPLALELAGELALLTEDGKNRPVAELTSLPQDYAAPTGIDPLAAQRFSYFIRAAAPDPADASVRDGFNEVLIVTPRAAGLKSARLGVVSVSEQVSLLDPTASQTAAITTQFEKSFNVSADGLFRDGEGNELEVMATGNDSLWLRFPSSINGNLRSNEHALIEVEFESQSFREGIEFKSFVRSSEGDEGVFQRVDTSSKDATELVDSSTARVSLMALSGSLIQDVTMRSIFTPNADGINDELVVQFALLKILDERPLGVEFFDLGGRLVGRGLGLGGLGKVGTQEFRWNGRDSSGALVPPGMYLCRISVEADQGDSELMRIINVAY
jgi:hypothetical protein